MSVPLEIFLSIQEQMRVQFYPDPKQFDLDAFITYYADHLIEEAGEIKKEVNWKTHRPYSTINREELAKEIIDAFLMILNMMTAVNLNEDDVLSFMRQKHKSGVLKIPLVREDAITKVNEIYRTTLYGDDDVFEMPDDV